MVFGGLTARFSVLFSGDLADELQPMAAGLPPRPPPLPPPTTAAAVAAAPGGLGTSTTKPEMILRTVRDPTRSPCRDPRGPSPRRKNMEKALDTLKHAKSRAVSPLRLDGPANSNVIHQQRHHLHNTTTTTPPSQSAASSTATVESSGNNSSDDLSSTHYDDDNDDMEDTTSHHYHQQNSPISHDSLAATMERRRNGGVEPAIHIRENAEFQVNPQFILDQKKEARRERRRHKKLQQEGAFAGAMGNGDGAKIDDDGDASSSLTKQQAKDKMQLMMKQPDLWLKFKQQLARHENSNNHEVVRSVLGTFVAEHSVEIAEAEQVEQQKQQEEERQRLEFQMKFNEHNNISSNAKKSKRVSLFESAFGSLGDEATVPVEISAAAAAAAAAVTTPELQPSSTTSTSTSATPHAPAPRPSLAAPLQDRGRGGALAMARRMSARNVMDAVSNSLRIESELDPAPPLAPPRTLPTKQRASQERQKHRQQNQAQQQEEDQHPVPEQRKLQGGPSTDDILKSPLIESKPKPRLSSQSPSASKQHLAPMLSWSPMNVRGAFHALAGEMMDLSLGGSLGSFSSETPSPIPTTKKATGPRLPPTSAAAPPSHLLSASHFTGDELREIDISSNEHSFSFLLKDSGHRPTTRPRSRSPPQSHDDNNNNNSNTGGGFVQKLKRVSLGIFSQEMEFFAQECEATMESLSSQQQQQHQARSSATSLQESLGDSHSSAFSMDDSTGTGGLLEGAVLHHPLHNSQFGPIEEEDTEGGGDDLYHTGPDLEDSDADIFVRAAEIGARHLAAATVKTDAEDPPMTFAVSESSSVADAKKEEDGLVIPTSRYSDNSSRSSFDAPVAIDSNNLIMSGASDPESLKVIIYAPTEGEAQDGPSQATLSPLAEHYVEANEGNDCKTATLGIGLTNGSEDAPSLDGVTTIEDDDDDDLL